MYMIFKTNMYIGWRNIYKNIYKKVLWSFLTFAYGIQMSHSLMSWNLLFTCQLPTWKYKNLTNSKKSRLGGTHLPSEPTLYSSIHPFWKPLPLHFPQHTMPFISTAKRKQNNWKPTNGSLYGQVGAESDESAIYLWVPWPCWDYFCFITPRQEMSWSFCRRITSRNPLLVHKIRVINDSRFFIHQSHISPISRWAFTMGIYIGQSPPCWEFWHSWLVNLLIFRIPSALHDWRNL